MFKHIPKAKFERQQLAKVGQLESENAKLKADVDYLAMMTDVNIDEGDAENE